tara:strand:- start:83 stop:2188 length:2106 start_codon:yes stop_codon:yes gene_type:complete
MHVMPDVILAPNPRWTAISNNGQVAAYGYVYTYDNDTRQPLATYRDAAGLIPHENPVQLDGKGQVLVYWLETPKYYLEVYDGLKSLGGNLIYSQANYPKTDIDTGGGTVTTYIDIDNYVRNPQFFFWRHGASFNSDQLSTQAYIADDWIFERSNEEATVTIDRRTFTLGQTDVPATPTYYLEYDCSAVGSGGETYKRIKQIYESVQTLENTEVTVQFEARYTTTPTTLEVNFYQFFGSGGVPSATVETAVTSQVLSTDWTRYTATVSLPTVATKTLGSNGDDALWLGFDLPIDSQANVQITNVAVEPGNTATDFEFKTAEEVKAFLPNYEDGISILDLGGDNSGVNDNTPAFEQARRIVLSLENPTILFPAGRYLFNSQTSVFDIAGNVTIQGLGYVEIVRNYTEGSSGNALMSTSITKLSVRDVKFIAPDGTSGGGFVAFGSDASNSASMPELINCSYAYEGAGTCDYGFIFDGSANDDGIKNVNIKNSISMNGATISDFYLDNVKGGSLDASITSNMIITGTNSTRLCEDLNITLRGANTSVLAFDWCNNINVYTCGLADCTNTANSSNVNVYGNISGTKQSYGVNFVYIAGDDFANNKVVATSGNVTSGSQTLPNGLIMKWGIVTVTGLVEIANVTFANAFPNAAANVMLTPRTSMPFDSELFTQMYYVSSVSAVGFSIEWTERGSGTWSFMWTAIGY